MIFFFKLATNAYHDDQQLLLLGERILRCLCGLPLFDLNPRSSALKVNVLTIGPPRITIIIKSKVNIVFKKMNNEKLCDVYTIVSFWRIVVTKPFSALDSQSIKFKSF